ncbi:hypothetical protein [Saccharomonospora xinjiangensis]|uniref:PPE family protein n=1 Tax=Saccharomonospora xinjiangensis XJ-54 TaxID=882086 RepID=I0V5R5_9PSEU|nr:hypothetical protein [Saccharomonospora xinjiangensis]EID55468.1 hypothetical protein SacxiDRAFT_3262 [Saccharomonospora xinjiangensis XJ-54]
MSTPVEDIRAVSDPASPNYDPTSPHYDVTADSSSPFYVGPIENSAASGDDLRALVTMLLDVNPLVKALSEREKDQLIQRTYSDTLVSTRQGLDEGLELRPKDEPPRTLWENASHEQMVAAIGTDADSAAVAETSEEWVRLGNELSSHQKIVAEAIEDSMGDWAGEGGDAARRHLAEVARWLGSTARGAVLTGRQQQIHSQTLNETQKQMAANPPVEFSLDEANAALVRITDPVEYAAAAGQAMAAMEAQRAAREQAARLMRQYDDTIGGAADMPLFTPPPRLAGAGGAAPMAATTSMMQGQPAEQLASTHLLSRRMSEAEQESALPVSGEAEIRARQSAAPGTAVPPMSLEQASGVAGAPAASTGFGGQNPAAYTAPAPEVPDFAGLPGGAVPGTGLPADGGATGGAFSVPDTEFSGLPSDGFRGHELSDYSHYSATSASGFATPDGAQPTGGRGLSMPSIPGSTPDSLTHRPPGTGTGPYAGPPLPGFDPSSSASTSSPRASAGGRGLPSGGIPGGVTGGGAGGAGLPGGAPGGASGSSGAPAQNSGMVRGPGAGDGVSRAVQPLPGQARAGGNLPMAGGMPTAGARQQEEDKEHRVAGYLTDEDGIFATEEVIAPPVIGDWSNKDWK